MPDDDLPPPPPPPTPPPTPPDDEGSWRTLSGPPAPTPAGDPAPDQAEDAGGDADRDGGPRPPVHHGRTIDPQDILWAPPPPDGAAPGEPLVVDAVHPPPPLPGDPGALPPPPPSAAGSTGSLPTAVPLAPPPTVAVPDPTSAPGRTSPVAPADAPRAAVKAGRTKLITGTEAILARPKGTTPTRGVVLLPDIGGLRPLYDGLCEELAATKGWAVCAPEAWTGREGVPVGERLERVGELDDDLVLGDALAAADATGCPRVAVLGFCLGGMFALKAAGILRFDRAVSFYGMVRLPPRWRSETMAEPLPVLEGLGRATAAERVLAVCGTADPYLPPEDLTALEATGAGVLRYPGADHAFVHDPTRPEHRPDEAADAWRRVTDFLR